MPPGLFTFNTLRSLPGVVHAVTTRHGGVSQGPYASLNMALHVGDHVDDVLVNRRSVCEALRLHPEHLVSGEQAHSGLVKIVTAHDRGRGALNHLCAMCGTDGLVTAEPRVPLIAFSADCPLVLLYDPVNSVAGVVHASWRGTMWRIAERAVRLMTGRLGCHAENIHAAISPSIEPCCYEVGEEIREAAVKAEVDRASCFKKRGGRLFFDLQRANVMQLERAGVLGDQIEVANICTACHANDYYSYRHSGGTTGRFAAVISLV